MTNRTHYYKFNYESARKQYDEEIEELIRRLQILKEERKRAEKYSKQSEHRLSLLLNQEKLV
jgi:hypothetical protein